jgi:hypothetical protein
MGEPSMRRLTQLISILLPIAVTALWISLRPASSSSNGDVSPSPQPVVTQKLKPSNRLTKPMNDPNYVHVIQETKAMVSNAQAQRLAKQYGLDILDISWEDTGRFKNSAVGPNISDMSIQVQAFQPKTQDYSLHLMPVIRFPNFADKSADVPLDHFFIKVGNHKGDALQRVALRDVLQNLRGYLTQPESWKGSQTSLLAPRDSHVLVSAQACFLPIPKDGTAQFNPVLFNYQSYAENPAVLTIMASREGTSVTVIDNQRDGFEAGQTWGQRLFFNQKGERASLTGQRISDFLTQIGDPRSSSTRPSTNEQEGLNMVLLIQVPLKQKERPRPSSILGESMPKMSSASAPLMQRTRSDVEAAVIGHGAVEGPFTEVDNLVIERDPRFPIRVTVQFYKGTSNGAVSAADMKTIHQQIAKVYEDADYVGSLVVDGQTDRPTEHDGPQQEPPDWWAKFWQRYEHNTGQSQTEAMQMLRKLRGQGWMPQSEEDLRRSLDQVN